MSVTFRFTEENILTLLYCVVQIKVGVKILYIIISPHKNIFIQQYNKYYRNSY
jgi:hypothetical protein